MNLASHLVRDASECKFDLAAIITRDSDMYGAIKMVNEVIGLSTVTINPNNKESRTSMMDFNKFNVRISDRHLEMAQFPNTVTTKRGSQIHKPNEWK